MVRSGYILFALLIGAGLSQAQVFTDDFESYGATATIASPNSFGLWNLAAGSIDVLNAYPGISCHGGTHCIDDGGTNTSGTFQRTFTATAGTQYTLTFWYSGSQRSFSATDSMTVTLGTASLPITNIAYTQGFTQGTVTWTATSNGPATVTFAYQTGTDNAGLIVDDVALTAGVSAVPVPPTITLSLTALLCLGAYGFWHMRSRSAAL